MERNLLRTKEKVSTILTGSRELVKKGIFPEERAKEVAKP